MVLVNNQIGLGTMVITFLPLVTIITIHIITRIKTEKRIKLDLPYKKPYKKEKSFVPVFFVILFVISLFGVTEKDPFFKVLPIILLGFTISSLLGVVCERMLKSKGYPIEENNGFWWGFFLAVIGLIVCALKPAYSLTQNGLRQVLDQRSSNHKPASISNQIKEINELKEQGLITEEEYEAKKKQILNI